MPYDVIPLSADIILPFFRDTGRYHVPRTGAGYLAGEFLGFTYDVVARLAGQNDVIMAGITPAV